MQQLVDDIADAIRTVDCSGIPFKQFQPGAGPYGEPQFTKLIASHLGTLAQRYPSVKTCRVPDVLIPGQWALEFKIIRPFGDNGREAEHWSQNLLHPYPGNVSAISDVFKLLQRQGSESRGIIVVSYEHDPPQIDVSILVSAFELPCRDLLQLPLGDRHTKVVSRCVHPVHQTASVYGWVVGDGRTSRP
jgi:hypothetical protein